MARGGDVNLARAELERLRDEEPDGIWAKLSDEMLNDFDWLDEYPELFSKEGVL